MENIRPYGISEFNETGRQFNPTEALEDEKTILSKFRGKAKDIAKVLLMVSGLTFGEGAIRQTLAQEKEQDATEEIKKDEIALDDFINLSAEEQSKYLERLSVGKILNLKNDLDQKFEEEKEPGQKEKINQAFLIAQFFILDNQITPYGKNTILVWNTDEYVNIEDKLVNKKNGSCPELFQEYLDNGKEGELTEECSSEVKKMTGNELSLIKQIYNLVAYKIPRFRSYYEVNNRYQTFEELLKNGAGICTEKNMLLIYLLRAKGIKTEYIASGGHSYTRVYASEGAIDIDITNSEAFNLIRFANKSNYTFVSNYSFYELLPDEVKKNCEVVKYPNSDDKYQITIKLDVNNKEVIKYMAKELHVSDKDLNDALYVLENEKQHPLNDINDCVITPVNCGKFKNDLFKINE